MTASTQQTQSIRKWILGVLAAILAGITIPTVTGAATATWNSKVSTEDYRRDRQHDSLTHLRAAQLDSVRYHEQRELLLDVLCSPNVRPTARQCGGSR